MIRVEKRPRRLAVWGRESVVLEIHPGGLMRVRRAGTRTWYETTAGAVLWMAAKAHAAAGMKRRAIERAALRAARRAT